MEILLCSTTGSQKLCSLNVDSYTKAMEKCQRLMDTSSIEAEDDASVHKRQCMVT